MSWEKYLYYFQQIGSRYVMVAGGFFLLFYVLLHKRVSYKKIQPRLPKQQDYLREIGYSIVTIFIFALVPLVILHVPAVAAYTTLYTKIADYGWVYFFAAFPLLFILHDTYFYWTHRAMHHKKLFPVLHLVHHKSVNPSPWAAYSFHPLEAIVEAGIFAVFLFTIPVHPLHLLLFFFFMIVYNVYGHLGYEIYPAGFTKHWFGKWINTSVNHNQHHRYFKGNYGLYFTFWDRVMHTIRPDYDNHFEAVTTKKKKD